MNEPTTPFRSWGILELMGHRRLGGLVQEVKLFGAEMARIDIPDAKDPEKFTTQFYSEKSIYGLTPCTEEAAREVARWHQPEPIRPLELTPYRPDHDDEGHLDDGDEP